MNRTAMDIEQNGERQDERIPYLPGLGQGEKLAEDEELVADMSCTYLWIQFGNLEILKPVFLLAYDFLHHARLTWPCLSFDVLRDVCHIALCLGKTTLSSLLRIERWRAAY